MNHAASNELNCISTNPSHSSSSACSKVTDLFLERAGEATLSTILALCPKLNTLSIRHPLRYSPSRTETNSVQLAAEYALSLLSHPTCCVRKLHLHNIHTLSGVDLLPLTCLEELLLSNIGNAIDNQAILRFARHNPNLNSISLYECEGLDGQTLIPPLLKACPKLHTLNFHAYGVIEGTRHDIRHSIVTVLQDVVRCCFPHIETVNLVFKK